MDDELAGLIAAELEARRAAREALADALEAVDPEEPGSLEADAVRALFDPDVRRTAFPLLDDRAVHVARDLVGRIAVALISGDADGIAALEEVRNHLAGMESRNQRILAALDAVRHALDAVREGQESPATPFVLFTSLASLDPAFERLDVPQAMDLIRKVAGRRTSRGKQGPGLAGAPAVLKRLMAQVTAFDAATENDAHDAVRYAQRRAPDEKKSSRRHASPPHAGCQS